VHLIGAGLHLRNEYVGFLVSYQFLPSIRLLNADVSTSLFQLGAQLYPVGGSFFVAAGFALYQFDATVEGSTLEGDPYTVVGEFNAPSLSISLGAQSREGFVLGIDLQLIVPLTDTDIETRLISDRPADDPALVAARSSVEDSAEAIGNRLPVFFQLNLLRVGYLF
jgi:hypothetical protein